MTLDDIVVGHDSQSVTSRMSCRRSSGGWVERVREKIERTRPCCVSEPELAVPFSPLGRGSSEPTDYIRVKLKLVSILLSLFLLASEDGHDLLKSKRV